MKKKLYNKLPQLIKSILLVSEGWLVGGSIDDILNDRIPKDYDIFVPSRENYQRALVLCRALSLDQDITINTFGGIKISHFDLIIDMWPEEFDHYISNANKKTKLYKLKGAFLLNHEE